MLHLCENEFGASKPNRAGGHLIELEFLLSINYVLPERKFVIKVKINYKKV